MGDRTNQEQSYRLSHMTTIPIATENTPIESETGTGTRTGIRTGAGTFQEPVVMLPDLDDNGDPLYKYTEMVPGLIKTPKKMGFFDAMYFIDDNISRATGVLITGTENCPKNKNTKSLRIGEKSYFTSGICGPESTKECVGQPRNIIVDNLPDKKKGHEGLIPSIIGDMSSFEPVEIFKGIAGKGQHINERCSKKNFEVVQLNTGKNPTHYTRKTEMCVPDYKLNFQKPLEPIQEDFNSLKNPIYTPFKTNQYQLENTDKYIIYKKIALTILFWILIAVLLYFNCTSSSCIHNFKPKHAMCLFIFIIFMFLLSESI